MAEQNNAICVICGKGYYKCVSCTNNLAITPWKTHTDTSEHYKVFQILRGETTGVYTREEARARLQNVDLSDVDTFTEHIKNRINSIMRNDTIESFSVPVEEKCTQERKLRKKYSTKTKEQTDTVP